jgi:hypothetical protein
MSEEELAEEPAKREEEKFQKAEAEIKQAIQDPPELTDLQKHLVTDQTPEGLRIQIVDREGKPMFASGSPRMANRPASFSPRSRRWSRSYQTKFPSPDIPTRPRFAAVAKDTATGNCLRTVPSQAAA